MKNGILLYIHDQFKLARINIIRSNALRNFEFIHDYRVALKRIRTITKFIGKISESNGLNNQYKISFLSEIYSYGGKLREIHINRKLLQEFENINNTSFSGFRRYLKLKGLQAFYSLNRIRFLYSYKRIKKYEDRLISAIRLLPEEQLLENIDQFIQNRIAEIEHLVTDKDVESKLHKIRKFIKSMKYLFEMIQINSRQYGKLQFNIERITILEDTIGDWHDLFVFKADVEKYAKKYDKQDPQGDLLFRIAKMNYDLKYQEAIKAVYLGFQV